MKLRKLKRGIAQALVGAMLVTSTGMSSLADVMTSETLDGTLGSDYKLVTLQAGGVNLKTR